METTYTYPRGVYGNRRPFQLVSQAGQFLSPRSNNAGIHFLRDCLNDIRRVIEPILPEGCPFVIGGGLVRDAILGGRPSDIDVWLPSNITIPDIDAFNVWVRTNRPDWQRANLFIGPGAYVNDLGLAPILASENYGDVNNHWVLEVSTAPDQPIVNFMRSMTPWSGDSQTFFNGLMRAFDIDYCMFFIGYMPGEQTVNTVIMPQHMAVNIPGRLRDNHERGRFRLNSLYWNKYRLDNTSHARIEARFEKMYNKYNFWQLTQLAPNGGTRIDIDRIGYIEQDQIIATPVRLVDVMRRANRLSYDPFPTPTRTNMQQREIPDGLFESILANRRT